MLISQGVGRDMEFSYEGGEGGKGVEGQTRTRRGMFLEVDNCFTRVAHLSVSHVFLVVFFGVVNHHVGSDINPEYGRSLRHVGMN